MGKLNGNSRFFTFLKEKAVEYFSPVIIALRAEINKNVRILPNTDFSISSQLELVECSTDSEYLGGFLSLLLTMKYYLLDFYCGNAIPTLQVNRKVESAELRVEPEIDDLALAIMLDVASKVLHANDMSQLRSSYSNRMEAAIRLGRYLLYLDNTIGLARLIDEEDGQENDSLLPEQYRHLLHPNAQPEVQEIVSSVRRF